MSLLMPCVSQVTYRFPAVSLLIAPSIHYSPSDIVPAVSGSVCVPAVTDGVDLYQAFGLVDAVYDPVGPAPGRVEAVERLVQRLACPVRVHGDRPLNCLHRGSSHLQGKVLADVAAGLSG